MPAPVFFTRIFMDIPDIDHDLLFLGIQGSGKGTQAKNLSETHEIIEAGSLLREIGKSGTELGNQVRGYQERGELVPNDVLAQVIRTELEARDPSTRVLIDGYPRTEAQMVQFNDMMEESGRDFIAIHFELSREEAAARMAGRGRADDTPQAIEKRLDLFEQHTVPVIEQYRGQDRLIDVDASLSPDEVAEQIQQRLRSRLS